MSATVTPKKRGRPPLHHLGVGMYFDYCTGLSIDQVAQKWGVTPSTVRGRFHAMRLPLRRASKGCDTCGVNRNPHDIGHVSFEDANRTRTRVANRVTVARAAEALKAQQLPRVQAVLQLRVDNPELSIAELGQLHEPPLSKDAVSGVLHRAMARLAS